MTSIRVPMKRRSFLAGAAVAPLLLTGRLADAGDLLSDIKSRGYMRVGTFSIPPECWIDIGSGEWLGIDADWTNGIAKAIGVDVDPVVITHAALAPSLQSGRLDAIAGLYRTEERKKVMAYNDLPIWYGIDVLITQKSNGAINSFADMKGKSLGTVRGSAQEQEATKLQAKFGVGDIKKYETADPMLLDLKAGRIDAAIWWGFTFDYFRLCGEAESRLRTKSGRVHAATISRQRQASRHFLCIPQGGFRIPDRGVRRANQELA
jgi:polar amino acid transport system substrate-binding protein